MPHDPVPSVLPGEAEGAYDFLRQVPPNDRLTYWIGSVARESAMLEQMAKQVIEDLVGIAPDAVHSFSGPQTLGRLAKYGASVAATVLPQGSEQRASAVLWFEAAGGLAAERNRLIHDVIVGSYGAASRKSDAFADGTPISERGLIELFVAVHHAVHEADGHWLVAQRARRAAQDRPPGKR